MTVQELIAKLQQMPSDATVVTDMFSECHDMREDEPRLETMIKRHGHYVTYREHQWDKREGVPQLITVCRFPGN